MSDVKKSKRKKSRLDTLDLAYDLRQQMTTEIMATFALSQKRLEQHLNAMVKGMGNKDEREALKKQIAEIELSKDTKEALQKALDELKAKNEADITEALTGTVVKLELDKQIFLIKEEREEMLRLSREVPQYLREANTIYPMYYTEWTERRKLLDLAMASCNAIQDELNYVARNIFGDRNKYCQIVRGYEKCYNMIKRLRQSDNKLLPKIRENEAKLRTEQND